MKSFLFVCFLFFTFLLIFALGDDPLTTENPAGESLGNRPQRRAVSGDDGADSQILPRRAVFRQSSGVDGDERDTMPRRRSLESGLGDQEPNRSAPTRMRRMFDPEAGGSEAQQPQERAPPGANLVRSSRFARRASQLDDPMAQEAQPSVHREAGTEERPRLRSPRRQFMAQDDDGGSLARPRPRSVGSVSRGHRREMGEPEQVAARRRVPAPVDDPMHTDESQKQETVANAARVTKQEEPAAVVPSVDQKEAAEEVQTTSVAETKVQAPNNEMLPRRQLQVQPAEPEEAPAAANSAPVASAAEEKAVRQRSREALPAEGQAEPQAQVTDQTRNEQQEQQEAPQSRKVKAEEIQQAIETPQQQQPAEADATEQKPRSNAATEVATVVTAEAAVKRQPQDQPEEAREQKLQTDELRTPQKSADALTDDGDDVKPSRQVKAVVPAVEQENEAVRAPKPATAAVEAQPQTATSGRQKSEKQPIEPEQPAEIRRPSKFVQDYGKHRFLPEQEQEQVQPKPAAQPAPAEATEEVKQPLPVPRYQREALAQNEEVAVQSKATPLQEPASAEKEKLSPRAVQKEEDVAQPVDEAPRKAQQTPPQEMQNGETDQNGQPTEQTSVVKSQAADDQKDQKDQGPVQRRRSEEDQPRKVVEETRQEPDRQTAALRQSERIAEDESPSGTAHIRLKKYRFVNQPQQPEGGDEPQQADRTTAGGESPIRRKSLVNEAEVDQPQQRRLPVEEVQPNYRPRISVEAKGDDGTAQTQAGQGGEDAPVVRRKSIRVTEQDEISRKVQTANEPKQQEETPVHTGRNMAEESGLARSENIGETQVSKPKAVGEISGKAPGEEGTHEQPDENQELRPNRQAHEETAETKQEIQPEGEARTMGTVHRKKLIQEDDTERPPSVRRGPETSEDDQPLRKSGSVKIQMGGEKGEGENDENPEETTQGGTTRRPQLPRRFSEGLRSRGRLALKNALATFREEISHGQRRQGFGRLRGQTDDTPISGQGTPLEGQSSTAGNADHELLDDGTLGKEHAAEPAPVKIPIDNAMEKHPLVARAKLQFQQKSVDEVDPNSIPQGPDSNAQLQLIEGMQEQEEQRIQGGAGIKTKPKKSRMPSNAGMWASNLGSSRVALILCIPSLLFASCVLAAAFQRYRTTNPGGSFWDWLSDSVQDYTGV